jgi:Protein of unknown function (DUF3891)
MEKGTRSCSIVKRSRERSPSRNRHTLGSLVNGTLWGNERFGEVGPWEEVCLGAAQHDAGHIAWEQAPMLTPQAGLPSSFLEMLMQIGSHLFIVTPVNAQSIASAFQWLVTPLYSASL